MLDGARSDGEIAAPDEDAVDYRDLDDRLDVLHCRRILDHGNDRRLCVGRLDGGPHRHAAIASGARRAGIAAHAAAIAAGRGDAPGDLDADDMRHEYARRPAVQHGQDPGRARIGDADDPGRSARACGQQGNVDRFPIEGRVLLVNDDEVKTEITEDFDGVGGRKSR